MGNYNSLPHFQNLPHYQNTWKICMKCNNNKILNTNLMILNHIKYREEDANDEIKKRILMRCDKGHILIYEGRPKHIDWCCEQIIKNNEINENNKINIETEMDELKKAITLLNEQMKSLDNNNNNKNKNKNNEEPSAPIIF